MRLIDADNLIISIVFNGLFDEMKCGQIKNMLNKIPIAQAIPIPDNATNGEVLKALFPNIEEQMIRIIMEHGTSALYIGEDIWWNAPYEGSDTE